MFFCRIKGSKLWLVCLPSIVYFSQRISLVLLLQVLIQSSRLKIFAKKFAFHYSIKTITSVTPISTLEENWNVFSVVKKILMCYDNWLLHTGKIICEKENRFSVTIFNYSSQNCTKISFYEYKLLHLTHMIYQPSSFLYECVDAYKYDQMYLLRSRCT